MYFRLLTILFTVSDDSDAVDDIEGKFTSCSAVKLKMMTYSIISLHCSLMQEQSRCQLTI